MSMLPRLACCWIVLTAACAPATTALSVGPEQPPRPPDCAIVEEMLTPQDAETHYRQVGVVCWSHRTTEDRNAAACGLGGEIVVRTRMCTNGEGKHTEPGVEYGVYTSAR
jgi:hypothetical protein